MLTPEDYFYISAIEKRAAKVIYKRYTINRHELNMLCSLAGFLQLKGRKAVGKKMFTDWIGANYTLEKRLWAYIEGLILKGVFHRLSWRNKPDVKSGSSLAISIYGIRILEAYYEVLEDMERKDEGRKKKPGFRTLLVDVNALPLGYRVNVAGRDN